MIAIILLLCLLLSIILEKLHPTIASLSSLLRLFIHYDYLICPQ